jgi:hypothetical protein
MDLQASSYKQLQQLAKDTGACKGNVKFDDMVQSLRHFYTNKSGGSNNGDGRLVFRQGPRQFRRDPYQFWPYAAAVGIVFMAITIPLLLPAATFLAVRAAA